MAMRTYRVRGTLVDVDSLVPTTLNITSHRRVILTRARDGVTDELDVNSDEVVRVEFSISSDKGSILVFSSSQGSLFALEHHFLSESPICNALELSERVPMNQLIRLIIGVLK